MAKQVDTTDVQRLIDSDAQLVEVLPKAEYDDAHLPGARNIPLARLRDEAPLQLDRDRAVVVYCWDLQCDLSSRAAAQLDALGFTEVYDYATSKAAWMGLDLPIEGSAASRPRVGELARPVPRCPADACVGDFTNTLEREGCCVVTDERGVVLGLLDAAALDEPPNTPVAAAAAHAPATVRPYLTARELAESMDRDNRSSVLVTLIDGRLVGRIDRADLDEALAGDADGS